MDKIVSVVGSSYFQPIADLLAKLERYSVKKSNQLQANYYENGYAVSICLLAVVCLESYAARVRYIKKNNTPARESVPRFLLRLFPDDFKFLDELTEVFVLRDSIAHNHLWEVEFNWGERDALQLLSAQKQGYEDKKYTNCVDKRRRKTKRLRLNVNPMRVDSKDVKKVLKMVWQVLLFLENKDRNLCSVSHLRVVTSDGKHVHFGRLAGCPETCT